MKSFTNWNYLRYINLTTFAFIIVISFEFSATYYHSTWHAIQNVAVRKTRALKVNHHHDHHWGPFFEESFNSTHNGEYVTQTAHLYTEAVLNCRVGMLKDKTVMWVKRTSDKVSLLTVGNITYSGDPRISVKFQYPNNWRLLINPIQKPDEGIYLCQVSTHPPRAFITNLTIIEPPLRIIDEEEREIGDRYYKSESTINLQCQISKSFMHKANLCTNSTLQPICNYSNKTQFDAANKLQLENKKSKNSFNIAHIIWAKDDDLLPETTVYNTSFSSKWFISRIVIPDAKLYDSGNYSCSLGKLFSAIVQVQVLTGELPAAVQHNMANTLCENFIRPWLRLLLVAIIQYIWNY